MTSYVDATATHFSVDASLILRLSDPSTKRGGSGDYSTKYFKHLRNLEVAISLVNCSLIPKAKRQ